MRIFLIAIIVTTFLIRFYELPQNLFFAFEQGRDLKVLNDIVINHKLTLIGPRTSIEGVFHGILYYYAAAIPFLIGQGNPLLVMAFFVFWQSLGVIFFSLFAREIGNKTTVVLGSLLYATSYGLIVYSRWFSHPPLTIPFSILMFWSLARAAIKEKFYILAFLSWGAIFHLDLVVAVFFIPSVIIYFFWQKPAVPTKRTVLMCMFLLLLTFLPYAIFDFRHQLLILNSLKKYLIIGNNFVISDIWKSATHIYFRYTSEIQDILAPNFFNLPVIIFVLSLIWILLKKKKSPGEKLVLMWVISLPTLAIIVAPAFGLKHYLVGLGAGMTILTCLWLTHFKEAFLKKIGICMLIFLILNNIYLIKDWLPINRNVFYLFPQQGMILGTEKKVIDHIYTDSSGRNFGWEAFTIPYWSNAGWDYLFSWYGVGKYGYRPKELKKGENFFVIIEPGGSTVFLNNWLRESMDRRGKVIEEKKIDNIIIQKRSTLIN